MADDAPYCGKEWAAGWAAPYLACHELDSTEENLACIAGLNEVSSSQKLAGILHLVTSLGHLDGGGATA